MRVVGCLIALALCLSLVSCGGGGDGGGGGTTPDIPANAAPVANAGTAQNVVAGAIVTLNGSGSSDANGDPLTYSWSLTSRPAGSTATLAGATTAAPTFGADAAAKIRV